MSKHLMFIGDPGKNAKHLLAVLRNVGLAAKRLENADDLTDKLSEEPPAAILFDAATENLQDAISSLRSHRTLASLPILLRVKEPAPEFLIEAFKWGVDDFFVEGAVDHFMALVSAIEKQDTWETVRAPAGQVILAHPDRLERAKFGRILKRNGFDTYFAGSSDELESAIRTQNARSIIVSDRIPKDPLSVLNKIAEELTDLPPFVVVANPEALESVKQKVSDSINATFFEDGSDAEGITFLLNELLAPPPLGKRRSPRVLYGTPVAFVHKGGKQTTMGFTFNINHGGIYIRTLASLPLQTEIEIRFRPPFGRGEVFADAQVVWRKQLGDSAGAASPPGMGVQFLHLWTADLAAFEAGYSELLEQAQSISSIPESPSRVDPGDC